MAEQDLDDDRFGGCRETPVNRRGFLAAAGLTGGGAALAACCRARTASAPSAARRRPRRRQRRHPRRPSAAASASAPARRVERLEKELFMYNWARYVARTTSRRSRREFGVDDVPVRHLRQQRGAARQAPGRRVGLRHRRADARSTCRAWSRRASSRSSTSRRIPNLAVHQRDVQEPVVGSRPTSTRCPRTTGRPASCTASQAVPKPPTVVEGVLRPRQGRGSGKTVFVDSMGDVLVFPLKMLGYSLNSVDQKELEAGPAGPARRRAAPPRARLRQVRRQDGRRTRPSLPSAGPARSVRSSRPSTTPATPATSSRARAPLFWLDTWVMLADAPHPNAVYAWLNFIHRPEVQGEEIELQPATRRRTTRRRSSSTPSHPRRPGGLPARRRHRQARRRRGHVGQHPAHRHLGGVQVRRSAADAPTRRAESRDGGTARRGATDGAGRRPASLRPAHDRPAAARPGSGTSSCWSCRW